MQRLDARSCLGLVLVIAGLRTLSQPLGTYVQVMMMDGSMRESLPVFGPVLIAMLQIASGCTFAFGKPRAGWGFLIGYLLLTVIFTLYALAAFGDEGGIALAAGAIELLGLPVVATIAFAIGRPAGSAPRSEAGALLVLLGVSSLFGSGVYLIERLRLMWPSFGALFGELVLVGLWITVAVLQTRAGLQLRRGAVTAERALKAYVLASLVAELVSLLVPVIFGLLEERDRLGWLFSMYVVAAFDGIAIPLMIWAFVRHHRAPVTEARPPTSPAWYALFLVPYLAARPLIAEPVIAPLLGAELAIVFAVSFAVQALAVALAARASLREQLSAARFGVIACVLGLFTMTVVFVMTQIGSRYEASQMFQMGQLLPLAMTGAVLAWLHRTAASPVPRATARSGRAGPRSTREAVRS